MHISTMNNLENIQVALTNLGNPSSDGWTKKVDELKKLLMKKKIVLSSRGSIIRLCYLDGSPCWSELSRSSRNTFWVLDENIGKWEILRMGLERGAEIARPGVIDTQDVKNGDIYNFDNNQQAIMISFMDGIELPNSSVLTSKSDGCCLFATFYRINDPIVEIIRKEVCINTSTKTEFFYNTIVEKMAEINSDWFPVFGTNGAFLANDDMITTWTQCLAATAGIELRSDKSLQNTLIEALPIVLPKMIALVEHISNGKDKRVNLSFEGIMSGRRDVWGEMNFYSGLAINYDWSGLVYLGATYGFGETVGVYRPHFEDDVFVSNLGFRQPLYWNIGTSTTKAISMLNDLDILIKGEITKTTFLQTHTPSNIYLPTNLSDCVIDYEGFVILDYLPSNRWHYNKLKTVLYYKLHKLRYHNFSELLSLSDNVALIFPNLKTARSIKNILENGLYVFSKKINDILDFWNPHLFNKHISSKISDERKRTGIGKAYEKAYENSLSNQLNILYQSSSDACSSFKTAFIEVFGFEPTDDKQLKKTVFMFNPRTEINLEEVRRELFYGLLSSVQL